MATTLLVILGLILLLIIYIVMIYNRLVKLKNRFLNAFSQIDVQLKRRYDLIPNLVETAKAYLKHEHETLTEVTEARNQALAAAQKAERDPGSSSAMKSLMGAEAALGGALLNLQAVMESYPDLKADQTMADLSESLSTTENRIAFARQAYNDEVMLFNTQRESFPDVMFAGIFGFGDATLWHLENKLEAAAPKVSFND